MGRVVCWEEDLLRGRCSLRELRERCFLPWLDGLEWQRPCADRDKVPCLIDG